MKKISIILLIAFSTLMLSACCESITDRFNHAVTDPINNLPEWKAPYTGERNVNE